MSTTQVFAGDTITLQAVFNDQEGDPIDPDSNAATFTAYLNDDLSVVETGDAAKIQTGIYQFDWLVPEDDSVGYVLEMKGLFSSEIQLKRIRIKAKFRP